MCGNWNVRQATSQQVLKVTTFCTDTCFQSSSPLINCIVHNDLLKSSPCRNKTLPQLVRIASIYAVLQHAPDAIIYRVEVRTAGLPQGLMNCGVSLRRSSTVSRARCASALSWWKANPAMLQIAVAGSASATRLCNTAR